MAALLMPKTAFLKAANQELSSGRPNGFEGATRRLAARFAVSREAAAIRLTTFGFGEQDGSSRLFA
jgi:Zn-dependent peptidase ImmA (M78 family)